MAVGGVLVELCATPPAVSPILSTCNDSVFLYLTVRSCEKASYHLPGELIPEKPLLLLVS
jgi:hypothetical protein